MARKELIPPEKWEGLKAALKEASGTKEKDKKDKKKKGKKGKKKAGKKKNARK